MRYLIFRLRKFLHRKFGIHYWFSDPIIESGDLVDNKSCWLCPKTTYPWD